MVLLRPFLSTKCLLFPQRLSVNRVCGVALRVSGLVDLHCLWPELNGFGVGSEASTHTSCYFTGRPVVGFSEVHSI